MHNWPRTRKIALRTFAAVCLLYLLTLATVQISQHILRHRAELLLADLQQLHEGPHNWADMQRMMSRWGKYGHYDGTCTAEACDYRIELVDGLSHTVFPTENRYALATITSLVHTVHWYTPALFAEINGKENRIPGWRLMMMLDVPETRWPSISNDTVRTLVARVAETPEPESLYWEWPAVQPRPEYTVTEPRCYFCLNISANFTASAPKDVVNRILVPNLECITRWSPCANTKDIFPRAWDEMKKEDKLRHANNERAEQCSFSIEEMTRASQVILRVSITGDETRPLSNDGAQPNYPVRLLEVIHGASHFRPHDRLQLNAEWEGTRNLAIYKGAELILLEEYDVDPAETSPCGTLPATAETLARVRRAAKDIPPNQP